MVITDDSSCLSKVWEPEMFTKMLSKQVHKLQSPGDEEADKLPESSQYGSSLENYLFNKQQTDGSCQMNCNTGDNKNVEEKIAITRNEEKNDDWVNPKKGAFYAGKWAYTLLLLLSLPLVHEAAPIKDHQPRQQDFCRIYWSELSESSGPWNDTMCSSELEKIQCHQTGQIKRCVRFILRNFFYAVCIIDPFDNNLKDDQCILITQIEMSNKSIALQCYEGETCSTPVSTSPPTSLKRTQDPLTVNTTNPPPNPLPIESSRGMMTAARDFGVCCLIISFISFIIVLLFICHFVGYALCLAQFQRSCNELWSKLISNIRNQEN